MLTMEVTVQGLKKRNGNHISRREFQIFHACREKVSKILRWSQSDNSSLEELKQTALSEGGLFNASIRQSAWLALLGVVDLEESRRLVRSGFMQNSGQEIDLIQRDVGRSALFRYQAVTGSITKGEQKSDVLAEKLATVLNAVVSQPLSEKHDKPSYYQGLHDVASVLLFNLDFEEVRTAAVLRKLIVTHLQYAAREDFSHVSVLLENLLLPYIQFLDQEVYQALLDNDVPLIDVVIPWLITLFTHTVHDPAVASRLMDAFVVCHPMLPFYMTVALLLHPSLRPHLLSSSSDPIMMHLYIQELPDKIKNDFSVSQEAGDIYVTAQSLIDFALGLLHRTPPDALLQFVGIGLRPRMRKRVLNKLKKISVLNVIEDSPRAKIRLQAEFIFRLFTFSRATAEDQLQTLRRKLRLIYESALEQGSKFMIYSRGGFTIARILLLFLLMPQKYLQDFMLLLRLASRYYRPKDVFLTYAWLGQLKNPIVKEFVYYGDMPTLVESSPVISISNMDNNASYHI